jgi:hypothetical protein
LGGSFSLPICVLSKRLLLFTVVQKNYNLLSAGFNKFYNILFLNIVIYRSSAELSGGVSEGFETILYLSSSHAPKSINLHRCEQKGRNFASSDCLLKDTLTIFRQIGHRCFILRYQSGFCCSGSVAMPCSSFRAYSTQYLAHGSASSRAFCICLPVPSQMP